MSTRPFVEPVLAYVGVMVISVKATPSVDP
jgi:hypothetical protein